ncbi:MarR family winged helix-turn-helix transcriptional regulator [Granulicella arctica]|uniref:DNA-binding MarR family transcriptional regulator n=1 Tax=Granulicella arctica TaxID=940613 RepID=A0A7Y9PJE9_9BACT|nr:MarR family transcriptional regulator [Granulicella arctica]NYF80178.1 DNA-binding MarR family transcriptional regulator [Granulicella arctica]
MSSSKATDLAEALRTVHWYMRRRVDAAASAQGLSLARAKLLSRMEEEGPCRPGELASQLGQAPRTLTDALDALERDGFAERKPHPTDRRALLVSVTNRGKKALRAIEEPKRLAIENLFRALTASQQQSLLNTLETIIKDQANRAED